MADSRKRNIIEIDDGTKEFSIVNKYGQDICKIHIRTSDMSILGRLRAMQDAIPDIVKDLENVDIGNDGKSDDMDAYNVIHTAEVRMAQELGKVFDTDEIMQIFEKRSMFSPMNGQFFVTLVLDALVKEIAASVQEETRKTNERIEKYMKPNTDNA